MVLGDRSAYALCRPPGHHAGRASFGGYCYFNNAAAAAEFLCEGGQRVAILDVDFHHGNGTQDLFYTRGDVLYVSIHGDPDHAYPYFSGRATELGKSDGIGANRNFPLPTGTSDPAYLECLKAACDEIARFEPAYLVLSLGLDTYVDDQLGDFLLTLGGYEGAATRVGALGIPTVVVQEGGYHLPSLGTSVETWLSGLIG
ncbi:hypothetical protein HYX70_02730 [Candidatus Saccharibacteria bacterium]|nr:hypothetical protein [Candidatus Saccharibacteria bacterium]